MNFSDIINHNNISSIKYDEYFKSRILLSKEFYDSPGKEHYRFLSYLSTLYNNVHILDIGTHLGETAIALSYNETNIIHSFDIIHKVSLDKKERKNIQFHIEDILTVVETREKWKDIILSSTFIVLDLDSHNGTMEYDFYLFLLENKYNGFVICDDIWYFKEIRDNFWYKIPDEYKYDITSYGHWSGTGVLTFNKQIQFHKNDNSDWTLVTAYFNLTKCPDASHEIKQRDNNYYLSHSISTLCLPYNLVIYCDNDSFEEIQKIRPSFLEHKTKYVIREFDSFSFQDTEVPEFTDFTFKTYREIINSNRSKKPYYFDNRNTASYYLFCMSRYIMLKETIQNNPFESTHFSWINFCIERMGYMNVKYLDEALSIKRNKFSTCYIDYIPKSLVENMNEYFKWGRCSMCSGFFTGNKEYMYKVCDLIGKKFLFYLHNGYGHADEQLYSPVYFENPDLFEHYYGDYQQMITNYTYVYDAPENPIRNFIRNSYENKNYTKCIEACNFLLKSLKLNKCRLDGEQINHLHNYYFNSKLLLEENYSFSEYVDINTEANFIYHSIIQSALNNNKNCCFQVCKKMIDCIKNNTKFPSNIYFSIYFSYYVSSFYVCQDESKGIVEKIFELCKGDSIFNDTYKSNKQFYDDQFKFINL
jgi:hypothetical protein